MDSPPGFSVRGLHQARILEAAAISLLIEKEKYLICYLNIRKFDAKISASLYTGAELNLGDRFW